MRLRGVLPLVVATFFWGAAFPVVKAVSTLVSPWTLLFLRYALASPIFLVYLWQTQGWRSVERKDRGTILTLALVGVVLHSGLQYWGARWTSATHAALLIATAPLFVIVLEGIKQRRKPGWLRLWGLILGFAGMCLIIQDPGGEVTVSRAMLRGDGLILGSALAWGYATYVARPLNLKYRPFLLTGLTVLGAVGLAFPFMVVMGGYSELSHLPWPVWAAASYLAGGGSVVGLWFWYRGLNELNASTVAMFSFLEPVFGMITSHIFLGERINLVMITGGILIIGGLVTTTLEEVRQGKTASLLLRRGPLLPI